jgi:3-methyladenine DNA glycosylase AlkD
MLYLEPLIQIFRDAADPEKGRKMSHYLKDQFPCLGLDKTIRDFLFKDFISIYGYPERKELFLIVKALWELPEREFQAIGIQILQKFKKSLCEDDIKHIEGLITTKSWWDTVDPLSTWLCGEYFLLFPENKGKITQQWVSGSNLWLKRAALLFQLKYKDKTDTSLLEVYIRRLAQEKEFFIRKAIGWVLREYSKTEPEWVRSFLRNNEVSSLSFREAKKYI